MTNSRALVALHPDHDLILEMVDRAWDLGFEKWELPMAAASAVPEGSPPLTDEQKADIIERVTNAYYPN